MNTRNKIKNKISITLYSGYLQQFFRTLVINRYQTFISIITCNIRGNTKSKTNYTYDIDIQQIKEDRKKYEKSQCFAFWIEKRVKNGKLVHSWGIKLRIDCFAWMK